MRTLSIKALIVVAFCVIFSVIIGTSTIVWLGQQRAQVALQQHQQLVRQATARVGVDLTEVQDSVRAVGQIMAQSTWVMLAARVFSLTMAVWLAWAIYRRVAQMVDATEGYAERIGSGDLGARFEADAGGETAALARALNSMVQRLREALQREATASERLTVLLQSAPISIYAARVSADFGTTYISPSVHRLLGYAPQDFTADPGFRLSHVHPDDQARVLAQQAKVMGGQSAAPLEYRFRHQDGTWRWMHDESTLVLDAAGQPRELVGSWIDISVRKALEQSLHRRDAIL